jgi:long-subunit fatty acid transport protein
MHTTKVNRFIPYFWVLLFWIIPVTALSERYSEPIEIPSSFNPLGSGARAIGMGGAYISIADDAPASSWNPGCLIQLKWPEISFVLWQGWRIDNNMFESDPGANGKQAISFTDINYFSLAYPFTIGNLPVVVSLSYQNLYDFNRKWHLNFTYEEANYSDRSELQYTQAGNLSAIGLAGCVRLFPGFSLGMTLNIWNDWLTNNGWEQVSNKKAKGMIDFQNDGTLSPVVYSSQIKDSYSFKGINFNAGIKYQINDRVTLGMVYKSSFNADLSHKQSFISSLKIDQGATVPFFQSVHKEESLNMPCSYGLGVSFRFSDHFTVATDIYRTNWQDLIHTDDNGNQTHFLERPEIKEPDIDPTHQIRIGVEYLFINPVQRYVVPFRAGVFYDPAPAHGGNEQIFGMSIGSGIAIGAYVFDLAYQFRFGNDIGKNLFPSDKGFSEDLREHMVYRSFVYHLK